jgi:spore maturation protein CgeB
MRLWQRTITLGKPETSKGWGCDMRKTFVNTDSQKIGLKKGRIEGYHKGWGQGYRIGRSNAVYQQLIQDHIAAREIKVLYVTSGIGVPYPDLDAAIIDGLCGLVRELIVVSPADPVAELAAQHRPDLVLAINGVVLPGDQVDAIQNQGIKTAIWFTDDPYYTDWTVNFAPHYEYVFTLEISCVPLYREIGCKHVHYLPFAVNPDVFYPKAVDAQYRKDISFIGTAYWNRVKYVNRLAGYLSTKNLLISGWWWDRLQQYQLLKDQIRLDDWLSAEETGGYYNGSRVVINLHRLSSDDSLNHNSRKIPALSINPRTFEINACNTLQLIDYRQELAKHYVPDREIVTYSSPEELQAKITYYLQHEEERREIAFRGFERTLQDHTYRKRLNEMLGLIFG